MDRQSTLLNNPQERISLKTKNRIVALNQNFRCQKKAICVKTISRICDLDLDFAILALGFEFFYFIMLMIWNLLPGILMAHTHHFPGAFPVLKWQERSK